METDPSETSLERFFHHFERAMARGDKHLKKQYAKSVEESFFWNSVFVNMSLFLSRAQDYRSLNNGLMIDDEEKT